jgi:hypothetical protein
MEIHDKKKLEIAWRTEWRTERKRMVKKWWEEKMNWRGGRGTLKANFTYGFTDGYKINYYFNLFRRWGVKNPSVNFEFRTKICNCPPYFSQSVGKSVGNLTRLEMHLMHNPLVFAQSVSNCVGKIENVPTAINSSVWSSVIWWHYQ